MFEPYEIPDEPDADVDRSVRLLVGKAEWRILPADYIRCDGKQPSTHTIVEADGSGGEIIIARDASNNAIGKALASAIAFSLGQRSVFIKPAPPTREKLPANAAPVLSHKWPYRDACLICGKVFRRSGSIRNHFIRAHGLTTYAFSELIGLRCERIIEPAARPVVIATASPHPQRLACWECGYSCQSEPPMARHLASAHGHESPAKALDECWKAIDERKARGDLGMEVRNGD